MVTKTIAEQRAEACIFVDNNPTHTAIGSSEASSPISALTSLMLNGTTGKLVVWDGRKAGSVVDILILPLEDTETALTCYKLRTFMTEVAHWPESADEHKRTNAFAGSALSYAALP